MVQIHACKMCVQANDTSIGTHKILLPLSFAAFMERGGGGVGGGWEGVNKNVHANNCAHTPPDISNCNKSVHM